MSMPRKANYTNEDVAEAVAKNVSVMGVLKALGIKSAGGSHYHMSRRIKKLELDTSHFTGSVHNKGKHANNRLKASDILVEMPDGSDRQKTYLLVRAMTESGVEYCCSGQDCVLKNIWLSKPLVLHVDHKDGNYLNNKLNNLQFLCPNCHSQTDTYCKKKGGVLKR